MDAIVELFLYLMITGFFKFKRYEESSLSYTGINRHEGEDVGGWDTVIKREEYERLFFNQQATMESSQEAAPVAVAPPEEKKPATEQRPKEKKPDLVTASYVVKPPVIVESPKPEELPAFDYDKVQEGVTVCHKNFGDGVIVWIDKLRKYIRVKFSAGEKNFVMESAFSQGFLSLK